MQSRQARQTALSRAQVVMPHSAAASALRWMMSRTSRGSSTLLGRGRAM